VHLSPIPCPRLNSHLCERLPRVPPHLRESFRPFAAGKSSLQEDSRDSSSLIPIAIPLPRRPLAIQHLEPVHRISRVPLSVSAYTREIHPHQCDSIIIRPLSALIPLELSLRPLSANEQPLLGSFNMCIRAVSVLRRFFILRLFGLKSYSNLCSSLLLVHEYQACLASIGLSSPSLILSCRFFFFLRFSGVYII